MIAILFDPSVSSEATQVASDLVAAFHGNVVVDLIDAETPDNVPGDVSWDDLLLVLFNGSSFPEPGNAFIDDFATSRGNRALILPVAVNLMSQRPPKGAETIKALPFDAAARGNNGRLVNRVGGMLGLRLQARHSKIFISYRATDGRAIAQQIHSHLSSLNYHPWQDEAKEGDGYTKILPGSAVQAEIDDALKMASLVLLIDTPSVRESPWIRHEVDTADAMLVPILPICFRNADDKKQGPRFRSLAALQRWVSLPNPSPLADAPLSVTQLDKIVEEIETYLCEIFRRKCRVPFIVEKEFSSKGYDWAVRDKARLIFESSKNGGRIRTRVTSHCSIFDQIYGPALDNFRRFIGESGKSNFSLFIYDGDLLTNSELEEMADTGADDVIVLHHQELSSLIASNFSNLGAP